MGVSNTILILVLLFFLFGRFLLWSIFEIHNEVSGVGLKGFAIVDIFQLIMLV
jgi:hypothetical protein